jgi:DNA-directed RNA polymerase specialized sigma24 family protein
MSVIELMPEEFDWPEPDAPRSPYMTKAQGKEQARSLYLEELAEVNQAIKGLRGRLPEIVKMAKVNGATWEDIGDALGTSRQAACRTYAEQIEA